MSATPDVKSVRKLTVKQRLKLMDAIWNSLADEDADIPIDPEILTEMRRRSEWAKKNPDKLISHEEMMACLRSLT
jgi:putative addiction module component (TIGR02574 family)